MTKSTDASFTTIISSSYKSTIQGETKVATQVRRADKTPGGDRVCLEFLVLFVQAKRTKVRVVKPLKFKFYTDKRSITQTTQIIVV